MSRVRYVIVYDIHVSCLHHLLESDLTGRGHCYPARPGEVLKLWQPPASCTWRLLLLDLRPLKDFEASRLPAAVHFDVAQRFPQTSWSGRSFAF